MNRPTKTCPVCDDEFSVKPSVYDERITCSKECHYERMKNNTSFACTYCGDDFSIPKCQAERDRKNRFCSKDCAYEWRKGENHHNYTGKVSVECEWCESIIEKYPSHAKRGRNFCDPKCQTKWQKETVENVGPNHHLWRGGHDDYGPNWKNIRKKALKRDKYRCQLCHRHEDDHEAEHGFGLDVHHITPLREFDDPKEANELENLVTLCRRCHRQVESDLQ